MSFLDDAVGGQRTQAPAAPAATTEPIEVVSSPIAIVAAALMVLVLGIVALVFWGTPGAVAGYVASLISFVLVLVYRRKDSVLRRGAIVSSSASVDRGVPVLTVATVVVMAVAVWIVATEVSRTL